jgi:small-conductance mechanosensitive channel
MRVVRYLLLPVAVAIICSSAPVRALAQVPGLAATPAVRQQLFTTAPITIDGFPVLSIAALANPPAGALPLATRLFLIDSAISQILAVNPDTKTTAYDPKSFKVSVEEESGEYALVATDAHHKAPLPILTVTAEDARHANLTAEELATQWQGTLQTALLAALERRQPATLHRSRVAITRGSIALALLTILGLLLFRFSRNRAAAVATAWVIALAWFIAVTYALFLFPETIAYGQFVARAAASVLAIAIAAVLVDWLLGIAVRQAVHAFATFGVAPGAQARALLRVPTMSKALGGFTRFLVVFIALLGALTALQIPIASVVTIGGIAAVAVGFAAQSLVRDFLNGLLVLFEDQYVVGDYIAIGTFNGIVEQLTLRVVQIRDSQGNLITIPHSAVVQVVNSSRNWSRIDYKIPLDAGTDVSHAFETLKALLDGLAADEAWRDAIIEPYEWMGLDAISKNGMMLRAVVRTAPLRQFDVRREINRRVAEAFPKAGVPLGYDQATTLVTPMTQSPDPS